MIPTNQLWWNETSNDDKKIFDPNDIFDSWNKNYQIANTAYPINHNETIKQYRVPEDKLQEHVWKIWTDVDDILLYAHVPFCERICAFCELSVVRPRHIKNDTEAYMLALNKEIWMYWDMFWEKKHVSGFDIWWWTPSLVDTHYISWIIDTIDRNFQRKPDMNISIETTPKIASEDLEKIRDYYKMWITRISMWVQSLSWKLIWRAWVSAEQNTKAAENIRKAWFEQFNVDIMYWFANQEDSDVVATVNHILTLDPDFVTLYPMRYKGTVIEWKSAQVVQDNLRNQYNIAARMLSESWYDIRPWKNTCSKIKWNDGLSDYLHHRVLHWKPYLGFWLWAQSFNPANNLSYNHWAHVKHNAKYIEEVNKWLFPIQDAHHLSKEVAIAKMMAISFFYGWVHLESFKKIFKQSIYELFPDEMKYINENKLMEFDAENWILQLTKKWVRNFSWVISLFYNPSVKSYLINLEWNEWMGKSQSVRDIK